MPKQPVQSKRSATPEARRGLHCEIDGLPAELDRQELSGAGVFVLTTQVPTVDTEVSIFLRIGDERFEMTGHVVQTISCEQAAKSGKKPGYAVLFTNLAEAERKRLSNATQSVREASRPPTAAAPNLNRSASNTSSAASQDPAELALLDQLKSELKQMDEKPAWTALGVSQGADEATVKAAFYQASKRYHPHLFARYTHPEIKRVVTELFIAHKRAFTSMTKRARSRH